MGFRIKNFSSFWKLFSRVYDLWNMSTVDNNALRFYGILDLQITWFPWIHVQIWHEFNIYFFKNLLMIYSMVSLVENVNKTNLYESWVKVYVILFSLLKLAQWSPIINQSAFKKSQSCLRSLIGSFILSIMPYEVFTYWYTNYIMRSSIRRIEMSKIRSIL